MYLLTWRELSADLAGTYTLSGGNLCTVWRELVHCLSGTIVLTWRGLIHCLAGAAALAPPSSCPFYRTVARGKNTCCSRCVFPRDLPSVRSAPDRPWYRLVTHGTVAALRPFADGSTTSNSLALVRRVHSATVQLFLQFQNMNPSQHLRNFNRVRTAIETNRILHTYAHTTVYILD